TSTIPTTPASNSWSSHPSKNPAALNSRARILVRSLRRRRPPDHDLLLFPQPFSLAPQTLLSLLCHNRLLFRPRRPPAQSRQAPLLHRRRNHRLLFSS